MKATKTPRQPNAYTTYRLALIAEAQWQAQMEADAKRAKVIDEMIAITQEYAPNAPEGEILFAAS